MRQPVFANGAGTAAFIQATAAASRYYEQKTGFKAPAFPAKREIAGTRTKYGISHTYKPGSTLGGIVTPGPAVDVLGLNEAPNGNFFHDLFVQGGRVSRVLGYILPGVTVT